MSEIEMFRQLTQPSAHSYIFEAWSMSASVRQLGTSTAPIVLMDSDASSDASYFLGHR
jgi:hypothetical protein